jgi:hypothetical protein
MRQGEVWTGAGGPDRLDRVLLVFLGLAPLKKPAPTWDETA